MDEPGSRMDTAENFDPIDRTPRCTEGFYSQRRKLVQKLGGAGHAKHLRERSAAGRVCVGWSWTR